MCRSYVGLMWPCTKPRPARRTPVRSALLRWQHPRRGLLLAAWDREGRAVPIAINASLHDLADGPFVQRVTQGLDSHGVRPALLRVEITEQALLLPRIRSATDGR